MRYKLSSIWTYWRFWIGNKIYQDIELAFTHFGNQLLVSDHLDDWEQLYNRVLHDGDADDRDGVKNDDDGDDSDYDNDA